MSLQSPADGRRRTPTDQANHVSTVRHRHSGDGQRQSQPGHANHMGAIRHRRYGCQTLSGRSAPTYCPPMPQKLESGQATLFQSEKNSGVREVR